MFIYTVFDKKSVSFGPLFTAANDEVAKRVIYVDVLKDSMLATCPADFAIYCVGEYNTNNGDVSGISPVRLVCEVLSLINVDKNGES